MFSTVLLHTTTRYTLHRTSNQFYEGTYCVILIENLLGSRQLWQVREISRSVCLETVCLQKISFLQQQFSERLVLFHCSTCTTKSHAGQQTWAKTRISVEHFCSLVSDDPSYIKNLSSPWKHSGSLLELQYTRHANTGWSLSTARQSKRRQRCEAVLKEPKGKCRVIYCALRDILRQMVAMRTCILMSRWNAPRRKKSKRQEFSAPVFAASQANNVSYGKLSEWEDLKKPLWHLLVFLQDALIRVG